MTITGLTNGTAYTIALKAKNVAGAGTASTTVSVTPYTTPAAPTALSATPGNGSASISFTPGSNGGSALTNYQYSTNSGSTFTDFTPNQTTSPVTITGLTNGTAYTIALKAKNVAGAGTASTTVNVTPFAPPTVTAVTGSADYGNTLGGKTVTITGTGFDAGAISSVTFDNSSASDVKYVSATSLTATTPAHAAGAVSVLVTTAGGTNTANTVFNYYPAPTVSAVNGTGDYANNHGGRTVTITGTNFVTGATSVTIGNTAANDVTVVSPTSLTVTTPAHAAGTASVLVTTAGGTNAGNTLFNYINYPAATSGTTWTGQSASDANRWKSVTYGNGLFVAVAESGNGNRVMTSPDGRTWTRRTSAADNSWNSVTYGNGLFVAVGYDGSTNDVMTSPDGITWTLHASVVSMYANSWNSVTYGNGRFVAVASGDEIANQVMTSSDGITWTAQAAAANNIWNSVTYGNGLFVAVSQDGTNQVMTSPDGITWTLHASVVSMYANSWNSVTYGNGRFVAVASGDEIANQVMTSSDGITWTAQAAAANNIWNSVTYGNGLFVAVGTDFSDLFAPVAVVMTSPDGITWTSRISAVAYTWTGVTYGNGQFVAVAQFGTNQVMTSPAINIPTVSTISPAFGSTAGSTAVTLTGFNFTDATAVTVGGTAVTGLNVASDTSLTFTTPPHVAGTGFNVSVTTPGGINAANTLFSYIAAVPTVTGVTGTGDYGNTSGNKTVTVTGSGFTGATGVTLGGTALTNFNVVSDTSLTFITPAGAVGTGLNVSVTSPGGTNTANTVFNYYDVPTVTAVNGTGDYANHHGGRTVTITGTNFVSGATSVTIGNTATNDVTVVSPTSLTVTTPAHAAGTASVLVTTAGGTNAGNTLFSYINYPAATSATTWTGQNASDANTWRSVTYGNGLFVAVAGSGNGNRVMTSPDGSTWTRRTSAANNNWNSVTYGNGLFVAVGNGSSNDVMTSPDGITWTGHNSVATNVSWNSVTYGNGLFVAVSNGRFITDRVMTSPDGITWSLQTPADDNHFTSVTYGNGLFVAVSYDGTNRVMTSPNGSTWTAHAVAVADANQWNSVTYGNGLFVAVSEDGTNRVMTSPDGSTWTGKSVAVNKWRSVTYGNGLFVAVGTDSSVPSAPVGVVMTSPDGSTWTSRISVAADIWSGVTYGNGLFVAVAGSGTNRVMTSPAINIPTVSTISPAFGSTAGSTAVTLTGFNFTDATAVTVGGTAVTGLNVASDTSLTFTTPPHVAGTGFNVSVTTPGGINAANTLFSYIAAVPTVTGVTGTGDYGNTSGNKTVTVTGSGFTGATGVTLGGTALTNFNVVSDTSLTFITPAGAVGTGLNVSVTSPGGTNTANSLFTYDATPMVSAISPAYGVTAGSTAVTLTGSGFTGATAVSLGGTAATNVTVVSDTSLTATTAAHAAGAASVLVTTIGGTNAANSLFSYTNCGPGLPLTTGIGALWQMLALPCVPTTSTIAGVLGDGRRSNLTTANYATATPGIGWIIEDRTVGAVPAYRPFLTSDISLNVGTGYWLKSYQAPTNGLLTMDGTTTPTDVTPAQGCASANGCKAITVTTIKGSNRYNLVGNPFTYPIDWSKVRVRVDGSALTLTPVAANSAGYISNNVNIWNGTTYDSFNDVSPTQGNLQYFKSFWVNVLPGAFGHTIELLIPAEQSTLSQNQALPANPEQLATLEMPWYLGWLDYVVSPAAAAPVPAVSDHVNPQRLAKPTDWYIRLKVDNPVTGWKDHDALLGQLSDAKTGFDGHDIPKMAPFSTPYLTLVFPHPDWGTTNAADYASDFHPVDLNAHSWSFEVRANPVGSKVFLSWEGSPALLQRSQLLEVATGKIILPTDPLWTIKGYPLTLNAAVQRYVWKVSAQ